MAVRARVLAGLRVGIPPRVPPHPEVPLTGPAPAEDRGSLRVVVYAVGFAMAAAFFVASAVPLGLIRTHRVLWFFLGVASLVAGSLLRRHCFRVLGAFFTGAVTVQSDHRVIDRGAYRWVRHPSYSAALLLLAGIGLALGSWLALAVLLLSGLAAYPTAPASKRERCSHRSGSPIGSSWRPAGGSSRSSIRPRRLDAVRCAGLPARSVEDPPPYSRSTSIP